MPDEACSMAEGVGWHGFGGRLRRCRRAGDEPRMTGAGGSGINLSRSESSLR